MSITPQSPFDSSSPNPQKNNPNTTIRPRRFSLSRSFSFSDAFPPKIKRGVSSSRESENSAVSPRESLNSDEFDYGSSWSYDSPRHLDSAITSSPFQRTQIHNATDATSISFIRRRYSAQNLVEVCSSTGGTENSFEVSELRRRGSLDSHLTYLEQTWQPEDDHDVTLMDEKMMEITEEINALMDQQTAYLDVNQPFVDGEVPTSNLHHEDAVELIIQDSPYVSSILQ